MRTVDLSLPEHLLESLQGRVVSRKPLQEDLATWSGSISERLSSLEAQSIPLRDSLPDLEANLSKARASNQAAIIELANVNRTRRQLSQLEGDIAKARIEQDLAVNVEAIHGLTPKGNLSVHLPGVGLWHFIWGDYGEEDHEENDDSN